MFNLSVVSYLNFCFPLKSGYLVTVVWQNKDDRKKKKSVLDIIRGKAMKSLSVLLFKLITVLPIFLVKISLIFSSMLSFTSYGGLTYAFNF